MAWGAVVIACVTVAGCGSRGERPASTLAQLAAGSVGCATSEMTDVRQRTATPRLTWSLTCPGGVHYHCSSQHRVVRCEPDMASVVSTGGASTLAPQLVSSGGAVSAEDLAAITRTRTDEGYALDALLDVSGAMLSLHAVPAVDARRVWLGVRIPARREAECRNRVLIDGVVTDMPPHSRVPAAEGEEVRGRGCA